MIDGFLIQLFTIYEFQACIPFYSNGRMGFKHRFLTAGEAPEIAGSPAGDCYCNPGKIHLVQYTDEQRYIQKCNDNIQCMQCRFFKSSVFVFPHDFFR
jgi:hypothetical protein